MITGAELVAAIRSRARDLGQPIAQFGRPLSPNIASFLTDLERAATPRPHTVARVQALLDGTRPPAPRSYIRQPSADRPINYAQRDPKPEDVPAPIERDPCFYCGTRADLGCRHQRSEI